MASRVSLSGPWLFVWGILFAHSIGRAGAQTDTWSAPTVAVGQWRSHLPFGKVTCVEKVGSKVYAGCGAGLFVYDLEDESLERITRVNGLHDIEVAALSYSTIYQTLIIAYANGNLDLYKNGRIEVLDAVLKANVPVGKKIRSIHQAGRFVYLCYGFGIVELDLLKTEIRSTFVIGPQGAFLGVNALVEMEGYWWAATDSGLYSAPTDAPNLQSFEFWTKDPYWGSKPFPSVVVFRDSLVTYQGDSLLWYKSGGHRSMVVNAGSPNVYIGVSGGQLQVVNTLRAVRLDEQLQFYNYPIASESVRPTCALYDTYQVWMGDDGGGFSALHPGIILGICPKAPPLTKFFN